MKLAPFGKTPWSRLVQIASGLLLLAASSQVHSETISNGVVLSGAVSATFPAPDSVLVTNGITQSGAVSVTFPAPTSATVSNGVVQSGAVSVTFPAPTTATVSNGVAQSGAVSVKFPAPISATVSNGVVQSGAVSVTFSAPTTATVSNGVAQSGAVSVMFKNPAGLWHLDDDWSDATGNGNHGTPTGEVSFDAGGRAGSAGLFDGSGDSVSMGTSSVLRPLQSFSLETWIKIDPAGTGSLYVAGNSNETSMTGYGLVVLDGCVLRLKKGDGSWQSVDSTTALTPGLWYHVAGTYDGSRLKIYINATLENDIAATGSITYASPFRIGSHGGASDPKDFFGSIDELSVYNRSLSAQEIAEHYESIRLDIIPPEPPTVSAVAALTAIPTQILSGTKESDVSIWVNSTVIVPRDVATTWQGTYTLRSGFNTLDIKAVDAVDNQSPSVILTVTLDDKAPVIGSSDPVNNSDTALTVGAVTINLIDEYSAIDLTASLAEAKVRNAVGQEIAGVWTPSGAGTLTFVPDSPFPEDTYTVIFHPTDDLGNTATQQVVFTNHDTTPPSTAISLSGTLGSDGWYSTPIIVSLSADDGSAGSGIDRTEYRSDNGIWATYDSPFVVNIDGITNVSYRSVDLKGNTETAKTGQLRINQAGVVGLWQMENDWLDSSYFNNDGLPANGATFSRDAKIGEYSGSFDGVNDYSEGTVTNLPAGNSPRTIMAWIKTDAVAADAALLHYGAAVGTSPPSNFTLYVTSGMKAAIGNGYGLGAVVGTSNVADGQWHLLAGTYQGNTATISVDGVEENSTTITTPNTASGGFKIGSFLAGSGPFHGLIDDLVVYNRVLSSAEISDYYERASMQRPVVDALQSPTAAQSIALSGTKESGTSILVNGIEIVPLDESLTWAGAYELESGPNTLKITAKNAGGYQSQSVSITVVLDDVPPMITGSTPQHNSFINTITSVVSISLGDQYSAVDLAATIAGATLKDGTDAEIPGIWATPDSATVTFTPSNALVEGVYTATIHPTDTLGNSGTAQIVFVYDIVAPPPPTISPVAALTNQSSQMLEGTKSADTQTVVVAANPPGAVGAVSYPTATTWRVSISGLHEGLNTITASARDSATNTSEAASVEIVYDSIPPSVPTANAVSSPTREATQTVSGGKDAETSCYVNGLLTASPFAATTWSKNITLSEGTNTIAVYVKDAAGNKSPALSLAVIKDTSPPRIATSVPQANSTTNQADGIHVTFEDDFSSVDLAASTSGAIVRHTGGATAVGTWLVQGAGITFTPDVLLTDDTYTVVLHPADGLGNVGTVSLTFTVDGNPPAVLSLAMNPPSPHKAEAVAFTITFNDGMATDVQPVVSFGQAPPFSTYFLTGGSWLNSTTWRGSSTLTASNGDGTYTVSVSGAQDAAHNAMVAQEAGFFVLDTLPPALPTINMVLSPTTIPNQTLSGAKPADTALVINSVERVGLNASTTWEYLYPLKEGSNDLSIAARDSAGNDSAPVTAVVVLDTTPPLFTIDSYKSPSPADQQTISGTKEPGCVVTKNGTIIFDAMDTAAVWTHELALTEGITNHFVFKATDALGNLKTTAIDIVFDASAPAPLASGVLVADGAGKGTELTLSWNAYVEPNDIAYYRVYLSATTFSDTNGMTPVGTTNKGTRSYKATGLVEGSTYYCAVVPVDVSGNFALGVTATAGVPTDTVPPEDVTKSTASAGYDPANGNFITLNWTASLDSSGDLAAQVVYFDNGQGYDSGTSLSKTATSFVRAGLDDATSYKFRITTRDEDGHESTGVVVGGMTRLGNPSGLTAKPGNAKVALAWDAVGSTALKNYNIYRVVSAGQIADVGVMTRIATVAPSPRTFTDTGLQNETTYQYAVTAVNTSGAERTDVLSVSAKPRMDETGPVIASFSVTPAQIMTKPVTISATAIDAESSMGRLELYLDETLLATQNGGSISWLYNTIESTDGNHRLTLIAYDQYGNSTTETRDIVVSLAPPLVPAITGHLVEQTQPEYHVRLAGNASISTTVILRVNGIVVAQVPADAAGSFAFPAVALVEGDNLLAVKAAHRGGESPYSADYRITVDTGVPPAPQDLVAQVLAGGLVRFTWKIGDGELPSGYNLYMSAAWFASTGDAGVSKTNTSSITYLLREYTPPDDALRYYAVTALDSSGNESGLSNVVVLASDRSAPSVSAVAFDYHDSGGYVTSLATTAGPGSVRVVLTVSETLKELPFFSLEPEAGSPIVLSLTKTADTVYEGSLNVTALSPQGATTYKFSGKDPAGNRGNGQGAGIALDVKGPVAGILAPITVLQKTAIPATVEVVFDEESVTAPVMELRSSDGTTAPIVGLASSDGGRHWTGTVNLLPLADGNAEFRLLEARDQFGNVGTKVASGKTILLYSDSVPPPAVPTGVSAISGKGGLISLGWQLVSDALSYNLYRRSAGEAVPALIRTGLTGYTAQDTPLVDDTFSYSLTSIGLLGSESQRSAEVQAVSDGTGPGAPVNPTLALSGSGITMTWEPPTGEVPATYRLYRSGAAITTTAGLTPVASAVATSAVDSSPLQSKRFYAVSALDALGNEGSPSETREILYPVSPVRNLALALIDTAAPVITWQAPADGTITGYHIYRNGSRLTQLPVTATIYTDGYYSGGVATYGISAVNDLNAEGPIREVMLPTLMVSVPEGTSLRRGLLETVPIIVTSLDAAAAYALTINTITVRVGTAAASTISGPFTLQAGSTLKVDKVVATTGDAPSLVAVISTIVWSPSPGVTVSVMKTSSVNVAGSSTALEIYNDPLVRGMSSQVRLKVNNIGSALMEFLTSENSGTTKKLRINLKDEDGNLLSTGYLDQRVGSAILNTGLYAVARINPFENILTDPILLSVPMSAPYKVIVEAVIDNTFYRYNKADQVTAPGMKQSVLTTISDSAYRASVIPERTFYPSLQPVVLSGQAINNLVGQPMPYVPVKLGISVRGFDRFYTLTTDAEGKFSYTFTPGANEAGLYSVWAMHPDVKDRTIQATFAIAGLGVAPESISVRMKKDATVGSTIKLINYGGASLTDVQFTVETSSGFTAVVTNAGDTTLTAGETQPIGLAITSAPTALNSGFVTLLVNTAEGVSTRVDASIAIVGTIPVITTSPSYIDIGMVRGNQKIANITISNSGAETLKNAKIEGPSTSWLTLTVNRALGDLAPGASKPIGILFNPAAGISQGVYNDKVVIYSDNHLPYTCHLQVTVTSDAVGNVLFDVLNELLQDVGNASIVAQNQALPELIYNRKTGADGSVLIFDIPEGRYSYNISAPGHKSYAGSFLIKPGITTTVPIALEVTLVQVEWSVTPIVIEDKYQINITTTFETNVPTPVLVSNPTSITVPELAPGQVFNGEFTVTNHGLIGVDHVQIGFPTSFNQYDIELLGALPQKLAAMSSLSVPYRITRRVETAYDFHLPTTESATSLFEEIRGYGGSPCYVNFTITTCGDCIICQNSPNQRTVSKCTPYVVIVPVPGSDCSISGGSTPGVAYSGGGGTAVGSGGGSGTQGSGGWLPGGEPTLIGGGEAENCPGPEPPVCSGGDCPKICTDSVVNLNNGVYEDTTRDLELQVNGIPLNFERRYVSRWVPVGKVLSDVCNSSGAGSGTTTNSSGSGSGSSGAAVTFKLPLCGTGSGSTYKPPQAFGWVSPWFALVKEFDGGIGYFDGSGRVIFFEKVAGTDSYLPAAGAERFVAEEGIGVIKIANGYRILDKSGLIKTFVGDRVCRMISIGNAAGNVVYLNYANEQLVSITDETDTAVLTLGYNTHGYLAEVTDQDGRTVRYNADENGRLLSVEGLEGQTRTYEYDSRNSSHLLKRKVDADGNEVNIQYATGGLEVIRVSSMNGQRTQNFQYDFPNRVAYYTNPLGKTTKYDISKDAKPLLVQLEGETLRKSDHYEEGRYVVTTDAAGNTSSIRYNERFDPIEITDGEGNVLRMEYNQYWKVSKVTDAEGQVTSFEYNTKEQVIATNYPDGERAAFEYDRFGNVVKVTKTKGTDSAIFLFEYDSRGNMTKMTDPVGNVTTRGYDQYRHLNNITDPNGNVFTITNDTKGRPLTLADPLGNSWTLTYDHADNITALSDPLGRRTVYAYDGKHRITSHMDALGIRTEYTYDGNGNLTQLKEAAGSAEERITRASYDNRNRVIQVIDPDEHISRSDYTGSPGCPTCPDGGGSDALPAKITDPLANVTLFSFDRNGRIIGMRDPMNNATNVSYNPRGKITSLLDANENTTRYQYDGRERVVKQTDANSGETILSYDARGNVASLTDAEGNTTTFTYDLADRLISETRPMGEVVAYTYYPNGLLQTAQDAVGQVKTYTYDTARRLTEIAYAGGKRETFTYDAVGNLIAYTGDSVSGTMTYDNLNRKLSESVDFGTFQKTLNYTYDSFGNKSTYVSPENTAFTYSHDGNDQITQIDFDSKAISLSYAWNRLMMTALPNGVTTDYGYNANGWLSNIITMNSTTSLMDKNYTYDNVGNIIRVTDAASAITDYSYDPTYQLTASTGPVSTEMYVYDLVGNRVTEAIDANPSVDYVHTDNNELTSRGISTYTYDANGNTLSESRDGQITTYTYDPAGRLRTVELPSGASASYIYDPFGRRVRKSLNGTVTYYTYSDEGLVGEYDSQGNVQKTYGWAPGSHWSTKPIFQKVGSEYYWYINDHLGTPQKLVDESGAVVWAADYAAFGKATVTTATVTNNLRFPGQYYDAETGLHYNWMRYYDPGTGRYTQVDSIGFDGGDLNLYAYVGGNPLGMFDPLGLARVGDIVFFNWGKTAKYPWPHHSAIVTAVDRSGTPTGAFGAWGQEGSRGFRDVDLTKYGGGIQRNIIGTGDMTGLSGNTLEDTMKTWNNNGIAPDWDGYQGDVCVDVTTALAGYGAQTLRDAMKKDFDRNPNSYKPIPTVGGGSIAPVPSDNFFYRKNPWLQQFFVNTGRYSPYK